MIDRKTYQRIFASGVEYGRGSMMVDSTSEQRTMNNVVRHEYRVLDAAEKEQMRKVKDIGLVFIELCDYISAQIGPSREMSIAKTKIEEAVMWAVKAITE